MVVRSRLSFAFVVLTCFAARNACACMPPPNYSSEPAALRTQADEVFLGQVRAVTVDGSNDLVTVKFRVSRVWKGSKRKIRTVTTHSDSGVCGLGQEFFVKEHQYLVYATKNSQGLLTGSLSGTKERSDAKVDLKRLGRGTRIP